MRNLGNRHARNRTVSNERLHLPIVGSLWLSMIISSSRCIQHRHNAIQFAPWVTFRNSKRNKLMFVKECTASSVGCGWRLMHTSNGVARITPCCFLVELTTGAYGECLCNSYSWILVLSNRIISFNIWPRVLTQTTLSIYHHLSLQTLPYASIWVCRTSM